MEQPGVELAIAKRLTSRLIVCGETVTRNSSNAMNPALEKRPALAIH
jgi:hypothetical protein